MDLKRLRTLSLIAILFFLAIYMLLDNVDIAEDIGKDYSKKNFLRNYSLLDYGTEVVQKAKRLHSRQILFWTPNYGKGLQYFCMNSTQLRNCPYKCDFTTNRSHLKIADAVVFSCRHLQLKKINIGGYLSDEKDDFPEFRMQRQVWVFYMIEAPVHTWKNLKPFNGIFNWTMTYRSDSDVYIPYGRLIPKRTRNLDNSDLFPLNVNVTQFTQPGKKLAAWVVTNCKIQPSRRNQFVEELKKYIHIDIYGSCGTLNCTPWGPCDDPLKCYKAIGYQYKFYLALENSLCVEYITEKFYNALRVGMVPVVFGYGDYAKVSPNGSFIDARSFETPKKLAEYLLFLDSHPEEYLKYFNWKKSYMVRDVDYFEDAWCSLCEKLWKLSPNESVGQSHSARHLENWWYHSVENLSAPACLHSMH